MFECFYEMLFCDQSTFHPFFLFFIFIFINVRPQSTFWNCFIHHSIAFIEIYSTISCATLGKSAASCCTTAQSCNRYRLPAGPVRSGPVEDSLPAGRNDFFSTGPVGIFFQFLHVFFEKLA
jgi:hypothetical protein